MALNIVFDVALTSPVIACLFVEGFFVLIHVVVSNLSEFLYITVRILSDCGIANSNTDSLYIFSMPVFELRP